MARAPNAVDFWRGLALIEIFINHVPSIYYSRFTHANVSISDSADLFVFLAGWSLRYVVGSRREYLTTARLVLRLFGRALTLYAAQIMITMIAIAMLAGSAILLDNPLLLEWHNAAAIFFDPIPTHVGLATVTHQLGYFDILPLYIVLMLMAPAFAITDRYAPNLLLPLSVLLYGFVLTFRVNLPTWPVEGEWFFNVLAWQLMFVLGFVLAKDAGIGGFARHNLRWLRWVAAPVVVVSALVVWFEWWPDPTLMPQPRLFFIPDKTYITPVRLIQFLAIVALFSGAFVYIDRYARPLTGVLALLGRNSLYVFCVGSLLSLGGQILRFAYRGSLSVDTFVLVVGTVVMIFTAWLAEWRERTSPARPAAAQSAS